jgi:hypothetical protein
VDKHLVYSWLPTIQRICLEVLPSLVRAWAAVALFYLQIYIPTLCKDDDQHTGACIPVIEIYMWAWWQAATEKVSWSRDASDVFDEFPVPRLDQDPIDIVRVFSQSFQATVRKLHSN